MKKIYTLVLAMLFAFTGIFAQNEFITQWDTRLTSPTGIPSATNAMIIFGAQGSNITISYTEMGGSAYSGTFSGLSDFPSITFPEPGIYVVKMSGLTGYTYSSNASTYTSGLLEIQQWGNTHWTNLVSGFSGCSNMDMTATDAPDLSGITNLTGLFQGCANLINANGSINTWDVSTVSSMYAMFYDASAFNQPLNNWNTSNVTDMSFMFREASAFNQNINNWDVSKVTSMYEMFARASAFNQPLNDWNTSNVTEMGFMFDDASVFNQNINDWDVSKVTDMQLMFADAWAFNQPLDNWNVSNVTTMRQMFYDAYAFNQNISGWNVSKVTSMQEMFENASAFNQNIGGWDLSSITDIAFMLYHAGLNCTNYDNTLIGWAANANTPNGLSLGADGLGYDTPAQAAHNTLTDTKSWTITDAGLSVGCSLTLPITLVPGSFHATAQNSTVLLSWATSTEINNKGFKIQRSTDGQNFTDIGFVVSQTANGNSTKTLSYTYADVSPLQGKSYYQLIQTDLDGHTTPSGIASVEFSDINSRLSLYPNPAHGSITIAGLRTGNNVAIYSTNGQLVKHFTATAASQKINISNLTAGVYFVKILDGNGKASTSFIVR